MFGIDTMVLAVIALAGVSAGGVAYAFLFNRIETEKQTDRRLESVKRQETDRTAMKAARERSQEAARRRKTIQDSLKEMEERQLKNVNTVQKPPLKIQLKQAGMSLTPERFYIYSVLFALAVAAAVFFLRIPQPLFTVPAVFAAAALGIPRWFVSFKRGRRVKAFLNEFPNALDVIVRAVKSGLPLNDGIRLIASESQEPVRTEFRRIVEAQQIGMSIPDAALRMPETMPCPEANFFGIVIQIQQQAGGNLSEALGNLSKVLRDRKKMKAKISALSMEARASAAIIGSLPVIVGLLVYISSPDYIMPLFTTNAGNMTLAVSGVWMGIGIFVMKNMMNFEV